MNPLAAGSSFISSQARRRQPGLARTIWPAVPLDACPDRLPAAACGRSTNMKAIPIAIPLPLPVIAYASSLKAGTRWTEGKETWEVGRTQKRHERNCHEVQVSTSFGRKRTLWIDTESPVTVDLKSTCSSGRGTNTCSRCSSNR